MDRMGDSKEKVIGKDFLQHCKIVDMDSNGITSVKQENLEKILGAMDSLKFQENTPSAVIAITGSTEKAKFILMNFLLDTLEGKGEKTQELQATIQGFHWSHSHRAGNSASIQRFLNIMEAGSDQEETNSEGIFLWPEPFLMKRHDERQVAIWIMNVCRKEGTNSEELEEITAMLSARSLKLECYPDNIRLTVLNHYRPITVSSDASYPEPIYLQKICHISTNDFNFKTEHLTDNIQINLNAMRNLNEAKRMNEALKIIANAIIEETVAVPSSETYSVGLHALLKIGSMKEVITSIVKKSNEHRQQRTICRLVMEKCVEDASKQIEDSFPRFLETWMKTQFSTSTRLEMLEVYTCLKKEILKKFENTVNTKLWEEFNELVDGRCKIEMEEILKHGFKHVDKLTRLAEQQNELLGYLPPQKLDEIAKDVLKQVGNFEREGKILVLDVCKLAHEKIADYYKEENKNILENEEKYFLQAISPLEKMYYDEVEIYLSNASYNPSTFENIRQKLLARFSEKLKSTFERKTQQELRRQEEKAKLDMEEYLPVAASKVKSTLPRTIAFWIQNHLQLSSVNQMESIYADTVKDFTEGDEYQKVGNKKLHAEFLSRLDVLCKAECMVTIKSISQPVMRINQAMKRQFGVHGNLTKAKMTQTADEELRKETGSIGKGLVLDMIKLAVGRLLEIYKKENKIFIEANEMVTAYRGQMEQHMANAPYVPPKQLHTLHSELREKMVYEFKIIYRLEKNMDDAVSSEAAFLSNRINREYEQYMIENEKKIAQNVIETMESQYCEKVKDVLTEHPDGLDAKSLYKYHTAIVTEVKKLLQVELRSKIRKKQPLENHLKVLQAYIDKYWLAVVEKNGKNIKKKVERDRKEDEERKRVEAHKELQQQQQEAAAGTKPAFSEMASGEHSAVSQCHSRNTENVKTLLPPLVYHLQSSRISMAMNVKGHFEMLKNEFGEEETPALVVWPPPPPERTFIYGSDAIEYLRRAPSSTSQLQIHSWRIADFFQDTDSSWSKIVFVNGRNHTITAEFLLAFLLRNLKHAAEDLKNGKCDTAVLAIPFWLYSTQRIKVKHAAEIAGFSKCFLINEASAAAFNFVLGDVPSEGEVLVISENFDRVDTFVYTFTKNDQRVKMVAHSGNYENWNEMASSTADNDAVFSNRFPRSQNTGNVDPHRACKVVLDQVASELGRAKIKLNACILICENMENLKNIFEMVVREFGRSVTVYFEGYAALHGAVTLSLNCNQIENCIRDKLAYDVLQLTFEGGVKIIDRLYNLPVKSFVHTIALPRGDDKTFFYQYILGSQRPIGELSVKEVGDHQVLQPNLEITNEAIVIVRLEGGKVTTTNEKYTRLVPVNQVNWVTPNLSREQLDEFADLLKLLAVRLTTC